MSNPLSGRPHRLISSMSTVNNRSSGHAIPTAAPAAGRASNLVTAGSSSGNSYIDYIINSSSLSSGACTSTSPNNNNNSSNSKTRPSARHIHRPSSHKSAISQQSLRALDALLSATVAAATTASDDAELDADDSEGNSSSTSSARTPSPIPVSSSVSSPPTDLLPVCTDTVAQRRLASLPTDAGEDGDEDEDDEDDEDDDEVNHQSVINKYHIDSGGTSNSKSSNDGHSSREYSTYLQRQQHQQQKQLQRHHHNQHQHLLQKQMRALDERRLLKEIIKLQLGLLAEDADADAEDDHQSPLQDGRDKAARSVTSARSLGSSSTHIQTPVQAKESVLVKAQEKSQSTLHSKLLERIQEHCDNQVDDKQTDETGVIDDADAPKVALIKPSQHLSANSVATSITGPRKHIGATINTTSHNTLMPVPEDSGSSISNGGSSNSNSNDNNGGDGSDTNHSSNSYDKSKLKEATHVESKSNDLKSIKVSSIPVGPKGTTPGGAPRRQYRKTILRQQAALLAAQIKGENEVRNTEATKRVLARTDLMQHLRTLRSRLSYAQYKVDQGLEEQPLHMVQELFDDYLDEPRDKSGDPSSSAPHLSPLHSPNITPLSQPSAINRQDTSIRTTTVLEKRSSQPRESDTESDDGVAIAKSPLDRSSKTQGIPVKSRQLVDVSTLPETEEELIQQQQKELDGLQRRQREQLQRLQQLQKEQQIALRRARASAKPQVASETTCARVAIEQSKQHKHREQIGGSISVTSVESERRSSASSIPPVSTKQRQDACQRTGHGARSRSPDASAESLSCHTLSQSKTDINDLLHPSDEEDADQNRRALQMRTRLLQQEHRQRQQQKLQQNQKREQELLRRQRQLEQHQQQLLLQQQKHKQLFLQLLEQEETEKKPSLEALLSQRRLPLSSSSSSPSSSLPLSAHRMGSSTKPNVSLTPKKKKPLNPVQKAPSTENILATARSSHSNNILPTLSVASPALSSAKSVLLGSKRVLPNNEDKENCLSPQEHSSLRDTYYHLHDRTRSSSPSSQKHALSHHYSPQQQHQRDFLSLVPPRGLKRQKPTSVASRAASPLNQSPRTALSTEAARSLRPPMNLGLTNKTSPLSAMSSLEDSIVANNLAGTSMQSSLVTQSIVPSDPTVTLQGNNKDYLNCFDQWMSDLGKGDGSAASTQDGQGLGEQSFAAATIATASTANPTISPATTSLPVGALAAAIHSNLTSQYVPLPVLDDDDGDFEAPNIDHLLYSDLGEDYGPFTGYGSSVGTPASELERYDLHSDAVSTDIYDWFPDVRSHHGATDQGGHPASDLSVGAPSSFADPSSSPFIPHRHSLDPDSRHRSLDYRQLSHLSTDPILSSSPGELSQGLDMGLEFEPTADPLWLQQELLLQQQHQQHQQQQQQQQQHQQHQQYQRQHQQHQQHQRQQHNVQQSLQGSSGLGLSPNPHHLMDTPLLESLSSSRGGTPQLSSSGGSSLLSSALSEMLSPSAILAQASYLPMGLGSQLDEEACSNSGGESRPFAKEQGNVRVAGTGVDFMLRTSI